MLGGGGTASCRGVGGWEGTTTIVEVCGGGAGGGDELPHAASATSNDAPSAATPGELRGIRPSTESMSILQSGAAPSLLHDRVDNVEDSHRLPWPNRGAATPSGRASNVNPRR
jgi:hypothetical protein